MDNKEFIHSFFYAEPGKSRHFGNLSYINNGITNRFFSYNTCIAEVITGLDGRKYTILSDERFSVTTARHISSLHYASPNGCLYLPQRMGSDNFSLHYSTIENTLLDRLESLASQPLTKKAKREEFFHTLEMLSSFSAYIKNVDKRKINKYRALADNLTNSDFVKKEKERALILAKKKVAKERSEVNKLIKGKTYLELVRDAYATQLGHDTWDYNSILKVRGYLNPNNDLSFAWYDYSTVKTSQGLTFSKFEIMSLLALWKANKLKHGDTFKDYTVVEVTPEHVKIGCHKIPTANIEALYAELNKVPEKATITWILA